MRPRTRDTRNPIAAALAIAFAVTAALSGCSGGGDPDPNAAADALAKALNKGDVTGIEFVDERAVDVQPYVTEILKPLIDTDHSVTVASTTKPTEGSDGAKKATATLRYSWGVLPGGKPWTYTTTVGLRLVDEKGRTGTSSGPRWEVEWKPTVVESHLKPGDRISVDRTQAARADIVSTGGAPIVTERNVLRLGVDKTRVDASGQQAAATALARVVGLDPATYAKTVANAGSKAFVEAIVVRIENPGVDVKAAEAIPGVVAIPDKIPLAPTREFARPVLGTVGQATAEIVKDSGGTIQAGDEVGLSGLEKQYDAQLRGTPGVTVSIVAPKSTGRPTIEAYSVAPVDGKPLTVSLLPGMQQAAEDILADQTSPSAIVAIRPSTGEVLAVASGPGAGGYSTATLGRYAPGSTFKMATVLAIMRDGKTPDSTVACPSTVNVSGRTFKNVPDYPPSALGQISLRTAFAHSCNTAMIGQSGTVTQQQLHDAAADLGIGVDASAQMGLPAYFGNVPVDSVGTEHAASMIGQGKVETSPLGMAVATASVAAGHRVTPSLVRGLGDQDVSAGTPGTSASPSASATAAAPSKLTAAEASAIRSMMRSVVTEGTGTNLRDLPGDVAAKTGTAQYGDGTKAHAWMAAIDGDLAVVAFVETGDYGATVAGPLLKEFLSAPATSAQQ